MSDAPTGPQSTIGYQGKPLGPEPHSDFTVGKSTGVTIGLMIAIIGGLGVAVAAWVNHETRITRVEDWKLEMRDDLKEIKAAVKHEKRKPELHE